MSRQDVGVKKVGGDAPSWLVDLSKKGDASLDAVRQYRQLPRAKVIQPSARGRTVELKRRFGEGAVVMMPGEKLIAAVDQPFLFVPLFLFTEFCKWSDLNDAASPATQGRSFDPRSEIARNSRDARLRTEKYGEQGFEYRYVEHLNFVGCVYGEHELKGASVTVTFEKGEFFRGTDFCSAIVLRKVGENTAPLWSQVWELRTKLRDKKGYTWYGYEFDAPRDSSPFIAEGEVPSFLEQHQELKAQFAEKVLTVDREDGSDEVPAVPSENEM